MRSVNLGNITLNGFEVPSHIEFGGKQKLIVHKLLGGARIIDAVGRDDAALRWRGILSGAEAADRARTLDAMRAAGALQTLTWDAFCYAVIISELRMDFSSPWWIPYDIICTVQQDLAQDFTIYTPTPIEGVVSDLTEAAQLIGGSAELAVISTATLLSSGPVGQQQVMASTIGLQSNVLQSIAEAEVGLSSTDIGYLVSSAGSLAQLCCAQGYLDRSLTNTENIGL